MPLDAFYGPAREPIAVAAGPVFVPLGLLAGAENEAEFAFLVSHAMAHIAMRHSTWQATRLELSGMAVQALPNAVPAAIRSASDQAQQSRAIEMASAAEVEADRAAIDTMAAAGYDPQAAVGYLQRFPAGNAARLKAVSAVIEILPSRTYSANTGQFEAVKTLAGKRLEEIDSQDDEKGRHLQKAGELQEESIAEQIGGDAPRAASSRLRDPPRTWPSNRRRSLAARPACRCRVRRWRTDRRVR
jgi:predicted Zn-dependent protease